MTYIVSTPKKGNKQFIATTRDLRSDPRNASWDDVIQSPKGKVLKEKETPTHHEVHTTTHKSAKEVATSLKKDHEATNEHPEKIKGMKIEKAHEEYERMTKK